MYILRSKYLMKCLIELFINFFHVVCCVDMADNPHRRVSGMETKAGSARRDRAELNPPPKQGLGHRNTDGEGKSQTSKSQVVDPMQEQHYAPYEQYHEPRE